MNAQPQTKTFARLVADYWARCAGNPLPPQATALYFYILGCLSRTGWRPVRLADREVAGAVGVARRLLSQHRATLTGIGLLSVEESARGSVYSLPAGVVVDAAEVWMEYAAQCPPVENFGANGNQSGANGNQSNKSVTNDFGANGNQSGANGNQSNKSVTNDFGANGNQ
uniref:hypothetical protein n=1 Tax=Alistipes putredinis TaxID=28117 RepID=UPI0039670450